MNWTPDHDRFIRAKREERLTFAEIAKDFYAAFGIPTTPDSVSGRIGRLAGAPIAPPDQLEFARAFSGRASWQDLLDIVENEALRLPAFTSGNRFPPTGSGTPESMNVVISDSHIGKLVEPGVVGPSWGYGKERFSNRVQTLEGRILRLATLHSKNAPISKLNLWFLGDLVDGTDMRRGHPHRVDVQAAAQQVMIGAREYSGLIARLAPFFDQVDANFQFGNHGRIGEFGVNLPMDNWDYVMSLFIAESVSRIENVRTSTPTTKYGIYDVDGLRTYAAHGDAVRGAGSRTSLEGYVGKLIGLHRQTFDLALLAHFHTSQMFPVGPTKVLMNGAWDGGDDFEVNQLSKANDPVQWAFGVSPNRGVTWTYEIQLAHRRQPTPLQEA